MGLPLSKKALIMVLHMQIVGCWICSKIFNAWLRLPWCGSEQKARTLLRAKLLFPSPQVITWAWACFSCLIFLHFSSSARHLLLQFDMETTFSYRIHELIFLVFWFIFFAMLLQRINLDGRRSEFNGKQYICQVRNGWFKWILCEQLMDESTMNSLFIYNIITILYDREIDTWFTQRLDQIYQFLYLIIIIFISL